MPRTPARPTTEPPNAKPREPEFTLYVFLKHGLRLPPGMEACRRHHGSDDPFHVYAQAGMSKGRLCEILADAVVAEIASGAIPGLALRKPPKPKRR